MIGAGLVLSWLLGCDEWWDDPALSGEIRRLFEERYPEAAHQPLYDDLRSVSPEDHYLIPFMLEKLFTGLDVYQWNMSIVTPPANRFHEGIHTIDQLIAGRLLERLASEDPTLAPYYRAVNFEEAYGAPLVSTIQPGGAVWPGKISELYDRSGLYHDLARAKQACEIVVPRARAQLAAPATRVQAATEAPASTSAGGS